MGNTVSFHKNTVTISDPIYSYRCIYLFFHNCMDFYWLKLEVTICDLKFFNLMWLSIKLRVFSRPTLLNTYHKL